MLLNHCAKAPPGTFTEHLPITRRMEFANPLGGIAAMGNFTGHVQGFAAVIPGSLVIE
jgi:hypothetical protein